MLSLARKPVSVLMATFALLALCSLPARGQQTTTQQAFRLDLPAQAQYQPRLATDGVFDHIQPTLEVELDRESYVAVFQIEPEVGAVLLYPHHPDRPALKRGALSIRMNGLQMETRRELFHYHLGHYYSATLPFRPFSHLLVVTSAYPMNFTSLMSGRVWRAGGFYNTQTMVEKLLGTVLSPRTLHSGAFGWDYHRVRKFRDRFASPYGFSTYGLGYGPTFSAHCPREALGYTGFISLFLSPIYTCSFPHPGIGEVAYRWYDFSRFPADRPYRDWLNDLADARKHNSPRKPEHHPQLPERRPEIIDQLQQLADRLRGDNQRAVREALDRLIEHRDRRDLKIRFRSSPPRHRMNRPNFPHREMRDFRSPSGFPSLTPPSRPTHPSAAPTRRGHDVSPPSPPTRPSDGKGGVEKDGG